MAARRLREPLAMACGAGPWGGAVPPFGKGHVEAAHHDRRGQRAARGAARGALLADVPSLAALEEEGSAVKFVALYDGSGNVRLTALSGDAVPNKDFELWAIQGGNNPISMGVIPVDQRSAVEISPDVMAGWGEGSVLAITLEEAGGSPDGNPHGPIVAKGAVTKI